MPTPLFAMSQPLWRSLATAGLWSASITLIAGLGLTVGKLESANAYRTVVYASLASAVIGAGYGLLQARLSPISSKMDPASASHQQNELSSLSEEKKDPWKNWREFVVVRKVSESVGITSFYLKPTDQGSLPPFQPGQFLTLQLDIPGQEKPIIRTYSLSDYSATTDYYRLSIKRELSPQGSDFPAGIASNFLHDHMGEGSHLLIKPPSGKFVLDLTASSPIILISNGVGITPMISMAKASSIHQPNRPIWFLHGARNGENHAFHQEMNNLALQNPHLRLLIRYSQPQPEDEGNFHSSGYVDIEFIHQVVDPELRRLSDADQAEYFLCGSPTFMESIRAGLKIRGIPDARMHFESFSKPRPTRSIGLNSEQDISPSTSQITFARSRQTLTWDPAYANLLEFAEAHHLDHPFGCRAGICLTCMCPLQMGEVVYEQPPTGDPDPGCILLCLAKPKSSSLILDA
ncbi:MAG: FAD-binding oxidoreductase [Cyanobacteriota bacterium]|nr:FAD-binding oxidoreductase [Cyanobacteriota bacterium]